MPYIKQEIRDQFNNGLITLPSNEGEMNYVITDLLDDYLSAYGLNYANVNALVGVLECAKLELYRRIAAPYEDEKIQENGDVYTNNMRQ
jgi:hypothetical protein